MPRHRLYPVIRLPAEDTFIVKPSELGGHDVVPAHKSVYMCSICRQVWTTRFHAEGCEGRDHVESFEQSYYVNGQGHPDDHSSFTFTAIRREEGTPTITPEPRGRRSHQSYRLEPELVVVMQRDSGQYRAETTLKAVYMCGSCGLVWALKHLADNCEPEGHPESVVQSYHTTHGTNATTSVEHTYHALRREQPLRPEYER